MSDKPMPQTGPMEFEGSTSGVFVRGDQAFYYAAQLNATLELLREQWGEGYAGIQAAIEGLRAILGSYSRQTDLQLLKAYKECKR